MLEFDGKLYRFKECLADMGVISSRVLLFGSVINNENPEDIDIAIIVSNEIDFFECMKTLSSLIADYTILTGLVINCTIIKESDFEFSTSQFIKNLRLCHHAI